MFTEPPATPVTTPPVETVTLVLLADHVPPGIGSVNTMEEKTQTLSGPPITPAEPDGFTVTVALALAVPHALVTV